jgi:hypothetical protein
MPPAARADHFQPVSPEELAMKSEPLAPGASAIILMRQVDRDDNGRTSHEDNYQRIKILTEDGRKYGDVEIPFYKGTENVVNIRARAIRPDGSIVNFEGKVFEKTVVKARGLKYLVKAFQFPDVHVGSILEYSYTIDFSDQFIYDSHWILNEELFTKRALFSLKPYRPSYSSMTLRWTWQSLPTGSLPQEGPDKVIRLEASNLAAFQTEDFMPPANEMKSRVDFIYDSDSAEPDPAKYWKKIGKRRNDQLESFVGKRKAMEAAVAQIVSSNDPPETKLRKIYDRVQQLRNTSYEIRKTEQEEKRDKEKPPENVEELWKRGYGDGTQLTWLYLGLVRAAGFEAYGCWVSARNEYFFSPKTEQSAKLNANVVLVKVNGKDMYFDPGAKFVPFGLLTWFETGVPGLKLDKDGGTWIATTMPEPSQSQTRRAGTLKVTETGDLEGKLTVTYTGLEAMYRRSEQRDADEVDRKKFLEDEVRFSVPAAIDVDLTNKPDWPGSETPLVAAFDLKVPGWVSGAGKRALLPVGLFSSEQRHLFEHQNRIHPIYMQYPNETDDDITIDLPLGWLVDSMPKPQKLDGHVIMYDLAVENSHGDLHITRKLRSDIVILDQKYYGALRNFYQSVRSGDEAQILLQHAMSTASN